MSIRDENDTRFDEQFETMFSVSSKMFDEDNFKNWVRNNRKLRIADVAISKSGDRFTIRLVKP